MKFCDIAVKVSDCCDGTSTVQVSDVRQPAVAPACGGRLDFDRSVYVFAF